MSNYVNPINRNSWVEGLRALLLFIILQVVIWIFIQKLILAILQKLEEKLATLCLC